MTQIDEAYKEAAGRPFVVCDFSPPRGGNPSLLEPARYLGADFISVAYSPGRSARVTSTITAGWIQANTGKDVMFALATRDMNRLALQSLLLGAQLLGVKNLVALAGDTLTDSDSPIMQEVNDVTPTELLSMVNDLNLGHDYKGLKLQTPTDLCAGASVDLGRDLDAEIALTRRKVEAGARFFLSQPTFGADRPRLFLEKYTDRYGEGLTQPMFHGIQVMTEDGIVFGSIPKWVRDDLASGRSGRDIALQVLFEYSEVGFQSIYLVPSVTQTGRRDYETAQAVIEEFRK